MPIYTFRSGPEFFQLKLECKCPKCKHELVDGEVPVTNMKVKLNNKLMQTGNKFVDITKLLGEKNTKILQDHLAKIYENYIRIEFAKKGYAMVKRSAT